MTNWNKDLGVECPSCKAKSQRRCTTTFAGELIEMLTPCEGRRRAAKALREKAKAEAERAENLTAQKIADWLREKNEELAELVEGGAWRGH